MVLPKTSRKGKKAWRRNIDATEVEAFLEDETHKGRREPAVETLKDEELFVVDTAADDAAVPAAVRKRARREPKPLRSQLILDGLRDGITPVHQPGVRKAKGPGRPLPNSTAAAADAQQAQQQPARKKQRRRRPGAGLPTADLWADGPGGSGRDADWTAPASGEDLLRTRKDRQQPQPQQQPQQQPQRKQQQAQAAGKPARRGVRGPAAADGPKAAAAAGAAAPAVEVDLPGCSFNPEPEAHQDAIALAVAAEYKKVLAAELAPAPPPQHAADGTGLGVDELEQLLVDAEEEEKDDGGGCDEAARAKRQRRLAAGDENAIPLDDGSDDGGGEGGGGGGRAALRKSRRDRNREARHKALEAEVAAKRSLKRQRQQLDALPALQRQLDEEEAARAAARQRREVTAAEKAAAAPPRLGKQRFTPAPLAVLTSDEVSGSLRRLAPCATLAADRYVALQRRGLVEPRRPARAKAGKRVAYVTGERRERAEEGQREVKELVAARQAAARVKKPVAGAAKAKRKAGAGGAVVMALDVGAATGAAGGGGGADALDIEAW